MAQPRLISNQVTVIPGQSNVVTNAPANVLHGEALAGYGQPGQVVHQAYAQPMQQAYAQPMQQPGVPYGQPAQAYAQPVQAYAQPVQAYAQPANPGMMPVAQPVEAYAQPTNPAQGDEAPMGYAVAVHPDQGGAMNGKI